MLALNGNKKNKTNGNKKRDNLLLLFRMMFSILCNRNAGGKIMSEIVRVVVDAMGGDNAPEEIVKGAIAAVNNHEDIHLILTGLQDAVERELKKYT